MTNYRLEVPVTYSLGSIMNNLLKQLTELRESCFLDSCFSIKACNLGTAIWKRCIGQGLEEGQGVSMHSHVQQPTSSLNSVLLVQRTLPYNGMVPLPYNAAITQLGICPKLKTQTYIKTCTDVFSSYVCNCLKF